jgi:hypothetical protein
MRGSWIQAQNSNLLRIILEIYTLLRLSHRRGVILGDLGELYKSWVVVFPGQD